MAAAVAPDVRPIERVRGTTVHDGRRRSAVCAEPLSDARGTLGRAGTF